jgi:hypothetical protein
MQQMQLRIERPSQRSPLFEGGTRSLAEVSRDKDLFERNHGALVSAASVIDAESGSGSAVDVTATLEPHRLIRSPNVDRLIWSIG